MQVVLQSPVLSAAEETRESVSEATETVEGDDQGVKVIFEDGSSEFLGGYNIVGCIK